MGLHNLAAVYSLSASFTAQLTDNCAGFTFSIYSTDGFIMTFGNSVGIPGNWDAGATPCLASQWLTVFVAFTESAVPGITTSDFINIYTNGQDIKYIKDIVLTPKPDDQNPFSHIGMYVGDYAEKSDIWKIAPDVWQELSAGYSAELKENYAGLTFKLYQDMGELVEGQYDGRLTQALIFDASARSAAGWAAGSSWQGGGYGSAGEWRTVTIGFSALTWSENTTLAIRALNLPLYVTDVVLTPKV
jgi:hypothetical protein